MAICIGRCLSKRGIIKQRFNFAFVAFFFSGSAFFVILFSELPADGRVVLLGAGAVSSLLWVVVLFPPPPPFGWCCFHLPALGGGAVPLFLCEMKPK